MSLEPENLGQPPSLELEGVASVEGDQGYVDISVFRLAIGPNLKLHSNSNVMERLRLEHAHGQTCAFSAAGLRFILLRRQTKGVNRAKLASRV